MKSSRREHRTQLLLIYPLASVEICLFAKALLSNLYFIVPLSLPSIGRECRGVVHVNSLLFLAIFSTPRPIFGPA
jgi:hypothetical protein